MSQLGKIDFYYVSRHKEHRESIRQQEGVCGNVSDVGIGIGVSGDDCHSGGDG